MLRLALPALLFSACKKTDDTATSNPLQNAENTFFGGTGIRKLGVVHDSTLTITAADFPTAAVGYDAGTNTVDWIYAFRTYDIYYNYKPGRQHINFATGDTLAGPGIPANPDLWAVSTDYYKFVPYTTQLFYPGGKDAAGKEIPELAGTAKALPFTPLGGYNVKLYADGRALSYYEDPPPSNYDKFYRGKYKYNGVSQDLMLTRHYGGKTDSAAIRGISFELMPDGSLLEFEASAKELRVVDAFSGTTLASLPNDILDGYARIDNSGTFLTRLSKNGQQVTGWIRNTLNNNGIINPHAGNSTTFVYDVATRKISIRISDQHLGEDVQRYSFQPNVMDNEGNLYYHTNEANGTRFGRIVKATPAGPVTVASGFFTGSSAINFLEVIDNKLFLGAYTKVADGRSESSTAVTGMLGVIDL